MKKLKWFFFIAAIISIVYLSGPSPSHPHYNNNLPVVPSIDSLDSYVNLLESAHHLKKDNEARIVWADSLHQPTGYSLVYLHGFSASQEEGNPVHRNVAAHFGYNLYLSRLSQHGIDTADQLINLTSENYWESAQQALAIGLKLGKKVILMGTSTGGTQALQLAAMYPDKVAGLILYSPNIAINDPFAFMLNDHWGLQIARMVKGGKFNYPADTRPIYSAYWNRPYRLEAVVTLQEMLETTMNEATYQKVKQPLLMLYYYEDEKNQDPVVRVDAMLSMYSQLGTPDSLKFSMAVPKTGNHVIGSPIMSRDIVTVENETIRFLEKKMKLTPSVKTNHP